MIPGNHLSIPTSHMVTSCKKKTIVPQSFLTFSRSHTKPWCPLIACLESLSTARFLYSNEQQHSFCIQTLMWDLIDWFILFQWYAIDCFFPFQIGFYSQIDPSTVSLHNANVPAITGEQVTVSGLWKKKVGMSQNHQSPQCTSADPKSTAAVGISDYI